MAKVRNLMSWAGDGFSYVPGDVIDLLDDVAAARAAAGLVELVDGNDEQMEPVAEKKKAGKAK